MKITTKLTAEVDTDVYDRITKDLHHGQLSQIIRSFIRSLDYLIQSGEKDNLYLWLYGTKNLTLPHLSEDKYGHTSQKPNAED